MPSAFKDVIDVISQLQKQKIAIDRAIAALEQVGDEGFEESASASPSATRHAKKVSGKKAARKRTLSPEARKRISDAVKKRWAAAKKAAKKHATKKSE